MNYSQRFIVLLPLFLLPSSVLAFEPSDLVDQVVIVRRPRLNEDQIYAFKKLGPEHRFKVDNVGKTVAGEFDVNLFFDYRSLTGSGEKLPNGNLDVLVPLLLDHGFGCEAFHLEYLKYSFKPDKSVTVKAISHYGNDSCETESSEKFEVDLLVQ